MELNDLSESQKELLQPLLRLKTDVSLDSLIVLRDVFHDISHAYNTFAEAIKDSEQKLLTCYNIASSGSVTPQACEALLMVRGNTPNVSNVVLSATAEQSGRPRQRAGVLAVMLSMLSFLNRVHEQARGFSNALDKSVLAPLLAFSNEYLKTFGKDEKRAFRQDISGFIPKLQEFKRSANYQHSSIKKYVDAVLKAHKELQDSLAYETELTEHVGSERTQEYAKLLSKAKNRTVRAKVSLGKHIQQLFMAAPDLKGIADFKTADVDALSQISRVSKKHADGAARDPNAPDANFAGTPAEYQQHFVNLERRRLDLFSSCLQLWVDNHVKYKKEVYAQLEQLWREVVKFSPNNDFNKFESYLTGKEVQTEATHARLWLKPEPGPIDAYDKAPPAFEPEHSTPLEQSEDEGDLDKFDMYRGSPASAAGAATARVDSPTEMSTTEPERAVPALNSFDNLMVVQLMQSPVICADYAPKEAKEPPAEQVSVSKETSEPNESNRSSDEEASARPPEIPPLTLEPLRNYETEVQKTPRSTGSTLERVKETVLSELSEAAKTPVENQAPATARQPPAAEEPAKPPEPEPGPFQYGGSQSSQLTFRPESTLRFDVESDGDPREVLQETRARLDEHMLNLFNRCKRKNAGAKFNWLEDEVEDIVKLLEDYDTYPFTHDYQNLENFRGHADVNLPMLRYALTNEHMDERQWALFALETLVLTHHHVSSFVNHPALMEEHGELRDFLLANLGVLDQTLIKLRKTIEAYRARAGVSDFEYSILEVLLRPRDSFANGSPSVKIHVMDVRYRVLLLIDAFSKGQIVVNSQQLFVIPEFYRWMYRQLHVAHVAITQKLLRAVNLIPRHSDDVYERWFRCLPAHAPAGELGHAFKFDDEKATRLANAVLEGLLRSMGAVNTLKEIALTKLGKRFAQSESADAVKARLIELLKCMVELEDADTELARHLEGPQRRGPSDAEPYRIEEADFAVDLAFFNDDDISVLAEVRHKRALCMGLCIPSTYRTRPGKFVARKVAEHDLAKGDRWNRYIDHRVDPLRLSQSWGMEEPVVLTICGALHKYLSCDDLPLSDFPQHFQAVLYVGAFMQTGVLPNFNLLKRHVPNENANFAHQIPLVAHSILAASAYWFAKIVSPQRAAAEPDGANRYKAAGEPNRASAETGAVVVVNEGADEFFQRLRISGTGIRERLDAMKRTKFRATRDVAKQLYMLLQMPDNLHHLPVGLGDLNAYLLFDVLKYRTGGLFNTEDLLPNYIYHDKSCIELITLANVNELAKAARSEIRGMHLSRTYNKVHTFLSQLLDRQLPLTFSIEPEEGARTYSLLAPSATERTVAAALYLRFASATFKNELFKCLCDYANFIDDEGLFYVLAVFVMLFRALYPRLSEHIPNLSLFESDEENDLYNMINIFRFIINKNAVAFTDECIQRVRETSDSALDETGIVPVVGEEMLHMLRYQCTLSSNIWNGFIQYAEFSSLLANCAILHLKNVYQRKRVDAGVLMPQLRKLMVLQRELDASYIVRAPLSDPAAQEQRLLNCMFFNYKNSNHRLSGYIEFMRMVREKMVAALEHKLVDIGDIVAASIARESWEPVNAENAHSPGAVDLVTVLTFSLKASFDLEPPVEWLILPFTNACEASIRAYYRAVSGLYHLKALYSIHDAIVSGEPPLPQAEERRDRPSSDDEAREWATQEESDKKHKKTVWKRLKHSFGAKSHRTGSHLSMLSNIEGYAAHFVGRAVTEDLTRVANLVYITEQLARIPEDIFGFYYNQIRQRDPEYEFIHRAIGTSLVSDVDQFFYFEPHQLLEIPASRSPSSLILASQRIMKRDARQCILDVITIVMWKIVLVDFRFQLFHKLYAPDVEQGLRVEHIAARFEQTICLFVERLPESYVQFAYNNFFEAFIKAVFYVVRSLRGRDVRLSPLAVKLLHHDVDTLGRALDKHSTDNIPLLENLKRYVRALA